MLYWCQRLIHANQENPMPLTPGQSLLKPAEHFAALRPPLFLPHVKRAHAKNDEL